MVDIKQTKQGAYPPKVFPAGAARSGCSFSHLVKQGTPAAPFTPCRKKPEEKSLAWPACCVKSPTVFSFLRCQGLGYGCGRLTTEGGESAPRRLII